MDGYNEQGEYIRLFKVWIDGLFDEQSAIKVKSPTVTGAISTAIDNCRDSKEIWDFAFGHRLRKTTAHVLQVDGGIQYDFEVKIAWSPRVTFCLAPAKEPSDG